MADYCIYENHTAVVALVPVSLTGGQVISDDDFDIAALVAAGFKMVQLNTVGADTLLAVQVLTGAGNYTPTPGTTKIVVELQAGGGGAGGAAYASATSTSAGAGGAGGNYARKLLTGISDAATYAYSCGGGGGGGSAAGTAGGTGSNTTFTGPGGTVITARGGGGGAGTTSGSGFNLWLGGVPGAAPTNADFGVFGQPGMWGIRPATSVQFAGNGGGSHFGAGGIASYDATGVAGYAYGGGGGGGAAASAGRAGGAGAAGCIVITEYR